MSSSQMRSKYLVALRDHGVGPPPSASFQPEEGGTEDLTQVARQQARPLVFAQDPDIWPRKPMRLPRRLNCWAQNPWSVGDTSPARRMAGATVSNAAHVKISPKSGFRIRTGFGTRRRGGSAGGQPGGSGLVEARCPISSLNAWPRTSSTGLPFNANARTAALAGAESEPASASVLDPESSANSANRICPSEMAQTSRAMRSHDNRSDMLRARAMSAKSDTKARHAPDYVQPPSARPGA